jgi:polyisoprenoid-binding protein YceI
VIVAAVVVAVGVGAYVLTRPDAPPPLAIDDVAAGAEGTTASAAGPADLAGTWRVVAGDDTVAGLRIDEQRAAGLGAHTAVGRTGDVTGSLVVADGQVRDGSFAVDLSTIEFTDDPGLPVANRSEYLRTKALETDEFPDARFEIAEPVDLAGLAAGTQRRAQVRGVLELHGVERPATIAVDVRFDGDAVVLGTSDPVTVRLADHGIEAPEIPGVAKVDGEGSFEFVVVLQRAATR